MKRQGARLALPRHTWLAVLLMVGMIAQGAMFGPALASEPAEGSPRIGVGVLTERGASHLNATGCGGPAPAAPVAAFEERLVELINAERAAHDLPPLKRVAELDDAARYHAADMAEDNYFERDTMDRDAADALVLGCGWVERVATFYPNGVTYGQNIAMNHPDAQSVFDAWMASSSTRANLLSDRVREIGVGYYTDIDAPDADDYWVLNIGKRRDVYPLILGGDASTTCDPLVSVYIYGSWQEMRLNIDGAGWLPWAPFSNSFEVRLWGYGTHLIQAEMRRADGTVQVGPVEDTISLIRCGDDDGTVRGTTHFIPFIRKPLPYRPLIVFASNRDGDWEIYLMAADGTEQTNLTNYPDADDRNPVPSRDGTTIYFESDRSGDFEIYALQMSYYPALAIGPVTQLSSNVGAYDGNLALTPPHERIIAFESDLNPLDGQSIYAMGTNGTMQTQLTSGRGTDSAPTWSPITSTLAFVSDKSGDEEIYALHCTVTNGVITPGPDVVNLTQSPRTPDREPAWSRDGQSLAFATERHGYWDIYRMNANGSGQINLTDTPADDRGPRWSRAGDKIAFASYRDGNWEIYVMASDGADLRRLTNSSRVDDGNMFDISWSPFDQRLAFSALTREFNQDIYVVNVDGTGLSELTTGPGDDINPSWFSAPR